MGFLDSYRRLSFKQKIALGGFGMIMGGVGPIVTEYMKGSMDTILTDDENGRQKLKDESSSPLYSKDSEILED